MRGLLTLTWLEIKIFVREPLGVIGTVGIPVVMFVVLGRIFARPAGTVPRTAPDLVTTDLPVLAAILIALSAVLSLITIIAIYREGGILKRLRATPLRSHTILLAHVLVKLLFTALTLVAMLLAGRRYYPAHIDAPFISFALALLFSTFSIISIGFLIASVVPTARFAQPVGTLILYPMLGISGLFVPIAALPPPAQAVARVVPLTYVVSLLRGVWRGDGWMPHIGDVAALGLIFLICTAVSSRVFRWE
jgi:ABC-2 type transport system permease protein